MFWRNRNMWNPFAGGNGFGWFGSQNNNPQQMYNTGSQLPFRRGLQGQMPQNRLQNPAQGQFWQAPQQQIPQQQMPQQQMPQQQMPQQQMPQQQIPHMQLPQQQLPQQAGRQHAFQPQTPLAVQPPMPRQPQIPQSNMPASSQFPAPAAPPQSIENNPPQNTSPAINNLKNVGTYMGYPEYTLPNADLSKLNQPLAPNHIASKPDSGTYNAFPSDNSTNVLYGGLKELSQNEKNGESYYRNLAEKSITEHGKSSLNSIAYRAGERSRRIAEMHNTAAKSDFTPENRSVKKDVGYFDGLRLALTEERQSLRDFAEIAEKTESAPFREKLNVLILEKLCQINELNVLITE